MPFSREVERLHELRRSLAIYRMVFAFCADGRDRLEFFPPPRVRRLPGEPAGLLRMAGRKYFGPAAGEFRRVVEGCFVSARAKTADTRR